MVIALKNDKVLVIATNLQVLLKCGESEERLVFSSG